MVFTEKIIMKNCRLCHTKPGSHELHTDKKLIKEIYDCLKIKVNDRYRDHLPHFICEECKKTIKRFSSFRHQIHKVDQCLRSILKNSESKDSFDEVFKCTDCPAEFNTEEIFIKHQQSHITASAKNDNSEIRIPCISCSKIFETLEDYGSHLCTIDDTVQEEKIDNGEENSTSDDTFEEKSRNTLKNSKHSKFVCNYKSCKKVLSSAYTLKTHELKHQGKRSFLCVTCGKGFITKNSLTCHEKIHLDVKSYICEICKIGFSVRSNLRAHEKKHHEGVRFYCSQCTKEFSSKCSLERHERIHTGIKEFKCQSCPSAFYTKKELLKHQRYHTGLRLHKCDECFKTFFERHHLIIHLRSHTGERPYVCKFANCGKSFTESQKLKRHHKAKHAQT